VSRRNHYVSGNAITLLRNGAEYFPALETAIDGAQYEIHLQTYIYRDDEIGRRIADALKRASARGVVVNLLLDGFGSKELPSAFVAELRSASIDVVLYRPQVSPWTLRRSRLRRLHRKVSVIDQRIAFVGGINIIDDMDVPKDFAARMDYAVRVEGSLVPVIHKDTRRLWRRIAWANLRTVRKSIAPVQPAETVSGTMRAMFVVRDNVLHRRDIERAYLRAIGQAKSEIIIANAYFLPGRRFRRALRKAAKRGVCVKLLLQGHMEYLMMFATHMFYSAFLRHNIEIHEYRKSFMHSKVAVIDGEWATVGSSNIDPFSLLLAREANIVVQDEKFAAELRADIEHAINDGAMHIDEESWRQGRIFKRCITWVMYGALRISLGLIGHRNTH
jgi:cardiolipin synthase